MKKTTRRVLLKDGSIAAVFAALSGAAASAGTQTPQPFMDCCGPGDIGGFRGRGAHRRQFAQGFRDITEFSYIAVAAGSPAPAVPKGMHASFRLSSASGFGKLAGQARKGVDLYFFYRD